jgi:hypothetical protein
MNEVAWCYFEGFGTKKDKVSLSVCLSAPPTAPATSHPPTTNTQIHPSGFPSRVGGADVIRKRQRWASTGFCSASRGGRITAPNQPFPHICDPSHHAIQQPGLGLADNNNHNCSSQRPSTIARPRRRGTRSSGILGTSAVFLPLFLSLCRFRVTAVGGWRGCTAAAAARMSLSLLLLPMACGELPVCLCLLCMIGWLCGPRFFVWPGSARPVFCSLVFGRWFWFPLSFPPATQRPAGERGCGPLLRPALVSAAPAGLFPAGLVPCSKFGLDDGA